MTVMGSWIIQTTYSDPDFYHTDTIPMLLEGNEEKRLLVDNLVAKLVLDLVRKLLNYTPDQGSLTGTSEYSSKILRGMYIIEITDSNVVIADFSGEGELDDNQRIIVVMLGLSECAYVGHRMLLTVSQQIAMVLERLQCMDPFDVGFSQIYENLFFV